MRRNPVLPIAWAVALCLVAGQWSPASAACFKCDSGTSTKCVEAFVGGFAYCATIHTPSGTLCQYRNPCPILVADIARLYLTLWSTDGATDPAGFPAVVPSTSLPVLRSTIAAAASLQESAVALKLAKYEVTGGDQLPGEAESALAAGNQGFLYGGLVHPSGELTLRVCEFDSPTGTQLTAANELLGPDETLLVLLPGPNGTSYVAAFGYALTTPEAWVAEGEPDQQAFRDAVDALLGGGPPLAFASTVAPSHCLPD